MFKGKERKGIILKLIHTIFIGIMNIVTERSPMFLHR